MMILLIRNGCFRTAYLAMLIAWLALSGAPASPQSNYGSLLAGSRMALVTPFYRMKVSLDPARREIEVAGTVRLPPALAPRAQLTLELHETVGTPTFTFLSRNGRAAQAVVEKLETRNGQTKWAIRPLAAVPAGEGATIAFAYRGGGRDGFGISLGPKVSFASGVNTAWYPQVEGADYGGVGTIEYRVPAGMTVVGSGQEAGGAPEREAGIYRFQMSRKSFFAFAAGDYARTARAGAVPVATYFATPRANVADITRQTSAIVATLASEFGPYPYREFALVEVPAAQANAAGFQGLSVEGFILVSSAYLDRGFDSSYFAHEVGHQWWGNLVKHQGDEGRSILDEAMAQYGALRVVETLHGRAAAEHFRRAGFGGGAIQYFELAAAGFDHRLDRLPAGDSLPLAWTKGGAVLDMLARYVGRDRFGSALRDLTRTHGDGFLRWDEFLRAVQRRADRDIRPFAAQWFERPGAPEWKAEWRQQGKSVLVTITQSPTTYVSTVELEAVGSGYQHATRRIVIASEKTQFTWPTGFDVAAITVDPHFENFHWTPEDRARAEATVAYSRANRVRESGRAAEAEAAFRLALTRLKEPDLYGAGFLLRYGIARSLFDQSKVAEAKEHLLKALERPSRHIATLPWVYFGLAAVARASGDADAFQAASKAAATADALAGGNTGALDDLKGLTPG